MSASAVLKQCESFEWRGPMLAALSKVENDTFEIIRDKTDWASVTAGKPVTDNRCSELADLYPQSRQMLDDLLSKIADNGPSMDNGKKRSPGLR